MIWQHSSAAFKFFQTLIQSSDFDVMGLFLVSSILQDTLLCIFLLQNERQLIWCTVAPQSLNVLASCQPTMQPTLFESE